MELEMSYGFRIWGKEFNRRLELSVGSNIPNSWHMGEWSLSLLNEIINELGKFLRGEPVPIEPDDHDNNKWVYNWGHERLMVNSTIHDSEIYDDIFPQKLGNVPTQLFYDFLINVKNYKIKWKNEPDENYRQIISKALKNIEPDLNQNDPNWHRYYLKDENLNIAIVLGSEDFNNTNLVHEIYIPRNI